MRDVPDDDDGDGADVARARRAASRANERAWRRETTRWDGIARVSARRGRVVVELAEEERREGRRAAGGAVRVDETARCGREENAG